MSAVIPVFNGARFVAKAVSSVRDQTVKDTQIIVVDDGSYDGTQEVLDELEKTVGITRIQMEHGGPARSRNRGIEAAQGEFVALLDCDDVWLPQKLEVQLGVLKRDPEIGVVHSDLEMVDDDGRVLERVHSRHSAEPMVQAFQGGHVATPSTLLIRRSVLEKVGGLDPALYGSEDSDLTIRLYACTKFECVDQVLVRKLERGHIRDKVYGEETHREKVLASRERFLLRLEAMAPLTPFQRKALDREWANYYLNRGHAAERFVGKQEARRFYWQAIRKAPGRCRAYARLLLTFVRN